MKWPETITCHEGKPFVELSKGLWRDEAPHRTCDYCGSLHPYDLLCQINAGAWLSGSDWKYGWPHKHYVHGDQHHKWYNIHLLDKGYDDEALVTLMGVLTLTTGITWGRDEGGIMYSAPMGYQNTTPRRIEVWGENVQPPS